MAGRTFFSLSRAQLRSWWDAQGFGPAATAADGDRAFSALNVLFDFLAKETKDSGAPAAAPSSLPGPVDGAEAEAPAAVPAPHLPGAPAEGTGSVSAQAVIDTPAIVTGVENAVAANDVVPRHGPSVVSAYGASTVIVYGTDFLPTLVYDRVSQTVLGPDSEEARGMPAGLPASMSLAGNLSGDIGNSAPQWQDGVVSLAGGFDYDLTAGDGTLGAGGVLKVSGRDLGAGDTAAFDGSGEQDGRFDFTGGAGADRFTGGDGNDLFNGRGGADRLAGGDGKDVFVFNAVSDSTGAAYDTLVGLDFGDDRIQLGGRNVTGIGAAVTAGTLSQASFDADLAAAMGAAQLGARNAALFTAGAGDLAGKTFLVVDGNGQAGYQAGQDFVFLIAGTPPADPLTTDFFI